MNLVDAYLRAVAILLPKQQRDDIVAELRDTILTRIEEREAELGRPLTEQETEAVLREVGHPLVVAARYRSGPQHVVGPALYPYWAFAVKAAVTIQIAVAAVVFLIRSLSGGNMAQAFGQATGSALSGAVTLIGFATVAAWLIERQGLRVGYLDRWRVRDLRMLEFAAWDLDGLRERLADPSGQRRWRSTPWRPGSATVGQVLGSIAAGTVFALWWIGALHFGVADNAAELRGLGLEPGGLADVDWTALKGALFWPVLAYGLAIIAYGVLGLIFPRAVRLRGLMNLGLGAAAMILCFWLFTASPLAPSVRVDTLAELVRRVETGFRFAPPLPLAPLATVLLALFAFGGLCRSLRGLWEIASGARFEVDPSAQPAGHKA